MKSALSLAAVAALFAAVAFPGVSVAHERGAKRMHGGYFGSHRTYRKYRHKRRPQVRGYVARRGGYSYEAEDTINTFGGFRGLYGSTNAYRNPWVDRQSQFGPFDNGFFFDSGMSPGGGNSPYLY